MSDILTVFGIDLMQVIDTFAYPVAVAAVIAAIVFGAYDRGGDL